MTLVAILGAAASAAQPTGAAGASGNAGTAASLPSAGTAAASGAAARRYVRLRRAGLQVRDAGLDGRAVRVWVRSRRTARLTFAVIGAEGTLTLGRDALVVRRARHGRTFTAEVRSAVGGGPVRLRVTARVGNRWARGTVALALAPAHGTAPVAPPPEGPVAPPADPVPAQPEPSTPCEGAGCVPDAPPSAASPEELAAILIRMDRYTADARNAVLREAFQLTPEAARAALVDAATDAVAARCADLAAAPPAGEMLRRAPATTREAATALATRCSADATAIARVLAAPPYAIPPMYAVVVLQGAGFTPWGPSGVAVALKNGYGMSAVEAARAFAAAASYPEDHFAGGLAHAYFGVTDIDGVRDVKAQLDAVFATIGRAAPLNHVVYENEGMFFVDLVFGRPVITCDTAVSPPADGWLRLAYPTACMNMKMRLMLAQISGVSVEQLPPTIEFRIPNTPFINTKQPAPLGEECESVLTRLKKGGVTGALDFISDPVGYATCWGQRSGSPAAMQPYRSGGVTGIYGLLW